MRKEMLILLSVVIIFGNAIAQSFQLNRDLTLRLDLSSHTFLKSEWVILDIDLHNSNSSVITTPDIAPSLGKLRLILKDSSGRNIEGYLSDRNFGLEHLITIEPKNSYFRCFNLLPQFGQGPPTLRDYPTETFLPNGSYVVSAYYISKNDTLFSNSVDFNIVSPTGTEARAWNLYKLVTQRELAKDLAGSDSLTDSLHKSYPQSVYGPAAYAQQINKYHFHDDKNHARKVAEDFVNHYGNSEYVITPLGYLLNNPTNKFDKETENRTLLNTFSTKYPNNEKVYRYFKNTFQELKINK